MNSKQVYNIPPPLKRKDNAICDRQKKKTKEQKKKECSRMFENIREMFPQSFSQLE